MYIVLIDRLFFSKIKFVVNRLSKTVVQYYLQFHRKSFDIAHILFTLSCKDKISRETESEEKHCILLGSFSSRFLIIKKLKVNGVAREYSKLPLQNAALTTMNSFCYVETLFLPH